MAAGPGFGRDPYRRTARRDGAGGQGRGTGRGLTRPPHHRESGFMQTRFLLATALLTAGIGGVAAPVTAGTVADLAAYARARAAEADGAIDVATRDYAAALAGAAGDPLVALPAFREAIRAGDDSLADRAASVLAAHEALPADAALLAVADAARARDPRAELAAIARVEQGQLHVFAPSLRAWAKLESGGDPLTSLSSPAAAKDNVTRRFAAETRALIMLATRSPAQGVAALRPLLGNDQAGLDNRIAGARLLLARGELVAARDLLAGEAPALIALRNRLDDPAVVRAAGARGSLAFGASHLFVRVASDLALGPPNPLSYMLVRAALRADPGNDRARLLLAGLLSKDGATDRAIAELATIRSDSIYYRNALAGRVQLLADSGRRPDAIALARTLAEAPDATIDDIRRLADLYMGEENAVAAAPLYRALIDRRGAAADGLDWLQYGAALDRAGQWPAAREALERAVALAPMDAMTLNYLGYGLVEHGERLDVARAMLEKAARLKPDDPAIADSLGWAYFRLGEAMRALPLIEAAATTDPGNAEIGEHLGDVYWRAGRRFEARYAWNAARSVATGAAATRLDGKIADGL